MNTLIVACVLMVTTPHGDICVKPDGTVSIPKDIDVDTASREFWEALARSYPQVLERRK